MKKVMEIMTNKEAIDVLEHPTRHTMEERAEAFLMAKKALEQAEDMQIIIDDVAYLYQFHIGEMAIDTIKATVDRLAAIKERLGGYDG